MENQINTFGDFFEDQVKNNNIPLNSIENNSSAYNRNRNVSADSTAGRRARGGKSRGNSNSTRPPAPTSKSVDSSSTTTSGTSNNQNLCEDVKCLCNKPSIILTVKKEGANKGRLFYACSMPMSDSRRCTFFQWCN